MIWICIYFPHIYFTEAVFYTVLIISFMKEYKHIYIYSYTYICVVLTVWGICYFSFECRIWTKAILVWQPQGVFTFDSVLQRAVWSTEHLQHSLPSLAFTESHWISDRIHSYAQGHLKDYVNSKWMTELCYIH